MTIEQRLYEILSPVVTKLFPVAPPVGTDPPYTVYMIVAQNPMTTQEGSVTGLKHWELQFCSYGEIYSEIDGRTQAIMDTLLPFRDAGIQAVLLKNRRTLLDTHYKLPESTVEFEVMESLGA